MWLRKPDSLLVLDMAGVRPDGPPCCMNGTVSGHSLSLVKGHDLERFCLAIKAGCVIIAVHEHEQRVLPTRLAMPPPQLVCHVVFP